MDPVTIIIFLGALAIGGCLSKREETEERERCGECHQNPERPMDGFRCLLGREDERCEDLKKFMDKHTIQSARITQPLLCEDCHTLYRRVTDPRHIDEQPGADLFFSESGRAAQRQIQPRYDPETKTCEVACHGLNLLGGAQHSPPWNEVQEGENCTGLCHTLPPAEPHPQNVTRTDCHHCHETAAEDGTIANPDLHINGRIDRREGDLCTFCHGQPPPPSPLGSDAERQNQIGAHQVHLVQQPLSTNVTCDTCHIVPDNVDDATHRDGDERAEITFDRLAVAGGVSAAYNPLTQTCTVYCHGVTRSGGRLTTPQWNDFSGGPAECDSCHGTPPEAPHIQNIETTDCHLCHTETIAEDGSIADKALHVNGRVDVLEDICTVCHDQPPQAPEVENHPDRNDCWTCHPNVGAPANPGDRPVLTDSTRHNNGIVDLFDPPQICRACHGQPPPPSPLGTDAERLNQIGAHQTHLVGQPLSTNVECSSCHVVPEGVFDLTHRDGDDQAEVVFSGLAAADEVVANYNPSLRSCSVYCHGASLGGGLLTEPVWNDFSGGPAECSSCHGVPPPPPHFPNLLRTDCHRCHTETVSEGGTIANRMLHVNGRVDVLEDICTVCHDQPPAAPEVPNHPDRGDCWTCHPTVGPGLPGERPVILNLFSHNNGMVDFFAPPRICITCHGSEENGPAPPPDTEGNWERTARAVGAHQAHLTSDLTAHVVCDSCHNVPEEVLATGHRNGIRDVVFSGGMGIASGVTATYNASTQSCRVYCHGVTLPGGARTQPVWTDVSGDPARCDGCHGFPPTGTGSHISEDTDCYNCHSSVDQRADGTWMIVDWNRHLNGVVDRD